jgi:toxin YoeB
LKKIIFDRNAIEDLKFWIKDDRKKAIKILELINISVKTPFKGIGKPEPLKYEFQGCWSRRIDREHRLVYEVKKDYIRILACRYHYY